MKYDEIYDVVIIGSGAGGLTAAACAAEKGLKAIVIEKYPFYGGTSAVSGGGIWIPGNHLAKQAGAKDSFEEAMTYMRHTIGTEMDEAKVEAYLKNGPLMVKFLEEKNIAQFENLPKYPDYYQQAPGAKTGNRSLEPKYFDASKLTDFADLRKPYANTLIFGKYAMTQKEAGLLLTKSKGWAGMLTKLVWNYHTDFSWRKKSNHDRRLTLGCGLVAQLRYALHQRQVPIRLNTQFIDLIFEEQSVSGVVIENNSQKKNIGARYGVIIACGGFERNPTMRAKYLPSPTQTDWSATPGPANQGGNMGDGIQIAMQYDAKVSLMNEAWWTPTTFEPNASQRPLIAERALPHFLMVNGRGERFVNEARPYNDIGQIIYHNHQQTGSTIPCWLILDKQFRRKYPMGYLLPEILMPRHKIPPGLINHSLFIADSLQALAEQINVPFENLSKTLDRFNRFAQNGKDEDFGRGDDPYDRYYGDASYPNPCLGTVIKPPFYAIRVEPGDLGTKGGLCTDIYARVLNLHNEPIKGLYAVGNTTASIMQASYPGPGSTIGPAMTHAFIAINHIDQTILSSTHTEH